MPTLSVTKTYQDGDVLFEADLDNIKDDLETFVNVTKLDDSNIQDNGITASSKIVDASITSGKIGAGAVTTSTILDSNVTTSKIADLNVTTAKINDLAVTTAKINDLAVTTAKINDGAVTYPKRASLNSVLSSSCASFTTTSTSYVDITNLSISITSVGRPLFVVLIPDGSNPASLSCTNTGPTINVKLLDSTNSTTILESQFVFTVANQLTFPNICSSYTPSAGTMTIKAQIKRDSVSSTIGVSNLKLLVYEIA